MPEQSPLNPFKDVDWISSDDEYMYANVGIVGITGEEVIIRLGQRIVDEPMRARTIGTVFMSLPHAKRLAKALTQSIERYEAVFGDVVDDPTKVLTVEQAMKLGIKVSEE